MRRYRVINAPVTLLDGTVELTADQTRRRRRSLAEADGARVRRPIGGVFRVAAPVRFKIGEVFGFEGDLAKVARSNLTEIGPDLVDAGVDSAAPDLDQQDAAAKNHAAGRDQARLEFDAEGKAKKTVPKKKGAIARATAALKGG